jgi:orotidine-5'-phosphate decarboxylase
LRTVRRVVGDDLALLVPGVGAQGADAAETALAGGGSLVVNSSRAILFADSNPDTFGASARRVALETRNALTIAKGPR